MIQGNKRTNNYEESQKKVGLFSGEVLCVNPTVEEYKEILGIDLKADSKAAEYLGESKAGNKTVRINIWVKDVKSNFKQPVTFFLEDKEKTNKEGSKKQYINTIGVCSWASEEENLPTWFKGREYRVAYVGEEEMYNFLRIWLGKLDFKDPDTVLSIDWKKLLKGNVKDIKEQMNGEYVCPAGLLAIVKNITKDGETKEYQGIYNRAFLPEYALKNFRMVDYSNDEVIDSLKLKDSKKLMPHERFVLQITDSQYGCQDAYVLKDLKDYDPSEFLVGSDNPKEDLEEGDPGY